MTKPALALREARNQALLRRFAELYEQQRMRLDDVYAQLAQEFFLTDGSVMRIIQRSVRPALPRQRNKPIHIPTSPNTP